MAVVWSCVVRCVVVVVVIGTVGRAGCLSLLLMSTFSIASHFELSSAALSQVMSLVRSFVEVVFPSFDQSSLFPVPFLLGGDHTRQK